MASDGVGRAKCRGRLPVALLAVALGAFCATAGALVGSRGAAQAQAQAQAQQQEGDPAERPMAAAPPGAALQTTKKAIWGLTEHNGDSLFPKYQDLGVGIFQTQARWDQIAQLGRPEAATDPDDPTYLWPGYLEKAVSEAESHGMEVMIQIIGTPRWANGGRDWIWAPTQPSDFADFATAIARRFPSVNLWMIWGEPNRKPNFRPFTPARPYAKKLTKAQARAPRTYSQLLDAAYGALKGVTADNLVIGGNTYVTGGRGTIRPYHWVRYMRLPDGSRPRMDMWGHNPYSYRRPNLKSRPSPRGRVDFSDLGRLAKALDRTFPGPPLRLFLSEFGVPTRWDMDFQFFVSPKTSVKWINSAFRIVRNWDRIYTLGWSVPVDTHRNPQGLLDSTGNPKPGYAAFKAG